MPCDEELALRVRRLLASEGSVTEKRMFGGLAFMVNGHMAVGINAGDLMVRVGADGHEDALARPYARPMDFTGRPMKGFVFVGPAGYSDDRSLASWVERGVRFVASLPPR